MNIREFLDLYKGPSLAFVATGGGMSLAGLGGTPGGSRVFHSMYIPYDYQASKWLLSEYEYLVDLDKSVSPDIAIALAKSYRHKFDIPNNIIVISCTAALITNRYRRGDNHAEVYIDDLSRNFDKNLHLILDKDSQERWDYYKSIDGISIVRDTQDRMISEAILNELINVYN